MADKNYGLTTVADAGEQDGGNSYSDVQRDGTEESKQVFDVSPYVQSGQFERWLIFAQALYQL